MQRKLLIHFLFCVAVYLMMPAVKAQEKDTLVTLKLHEVLWEDVVKQIGQQTTMNCGGAIYTPIRVTDTLVNCPLRDALSYLCQKYKFTFEINSDYIYFKELISIHGKVTDENNTPLTRISVSVKGTTTGTTTDDNGVFELNTVEPEATLVFTSVGTETYELKVNGRTSLTVTLKRRYSNLDPALIEYNTGLQVIDKTKATGSYRQTDQKSPGSYIAINNDHLLSRTPDGILRHDGKRWVRGLSTILADQQPLIVLNNFPYDGDLNSIQPDEVESITVLKDAAATAIWGARAGNGVIVINTNRGRFKQPLQAELTSGLIITPKYDLNKSRNFISSGEFIKMEEFLYNRGYYDMALADNRMAVSPVAQILYDRQYGFISAADASARLDSLSRNDVRKDLDKYYYRTAVTQRYNFSVSGSDSLNAWHVFLGYENNAAGRTHNERQQYIMSANNTHRWPKERLQVYTATRVAVHKEKNNNLVNPPEIYPYSKLANDAGDALPVIKDHKETYPAAADAGRLLDWKYRPLDELNMANNKTDVLHFLADAGLQYDINKHLIIKGLYRMERKTYDNKDLRSLQTYYTRNLINEFTQVNGNSFSYGIPIGDILDKGENIYRADDIGFRLQFAKEWNREHPEKSMSLEVLAGTDAKMVNISTHKERLYGYNEGDQTSKRPNYNTLYQLYGTNTQTRVHYINDYHTANENYLSAYTSAIYHYGKQLTLSGSLRQDATNTFGWHTNQRFAPLWSLGLSWEINRHFKNARLPITIFKINRGISGNIYKQVSSEPTVYITRDNQTNEPMAVPVTLPNPDLRWERSLMTSIGLELATNNKQLSLSADYYFKKNTDLFGMSQVDPGSGFRNMLGNFAAMKGSGFEINLSANYRIGHMDWTSMLQLNHARDKITSYKNSPPRVGDFFIPGQPMPKEGYSLNALYSVKTMGLDGSGKLIGYYKGQPSQQFNTILQSTDVDGHLVYMGSSVPLYFGTWKNYLAWGHFNMSVMLTYKMGYYFSRPSVNYTDLVNNRVAHSDFMIRWMQSGDEKNTFVPAFTFPVDDGQNVYYSVSDLLVEKGDHIRLQEIFLGGVLDKTIIRRLPFEKVIVNAGANNIGILWRANKLGLDPDLPGDFASPPTFLIGLKIIF